MSERLSPIFIHDFEQPIWQMALEPEKGLLALELRDPKEASVSFSLLNLHTQTLVFDRYAFEEDWWMSMVTIKDNLLLIKQYHDSQQPEKQALLAINIGTMEVEWWLQNFQLLQLNELSVSGKQHDESESIVKHYEINSGQELAADLVDKSNVQEQSIKAKYPTHYDSESSHLETVKSFISNYFNMKSVGPCDYLEVGNLIVISWFYSEGGSYANVLSVIDSEGNIVIEEKIGTGLDAFAADTFFVLKNRLIFVSNKTQLIVYELFEGA
ncbi:MAG: DUF4905 domain-containing protein [Imperialibacter sp.]|uniref:DUF4905 domain-containing protein n=1 Tax=Imperialibacter sp. TaxID=2038411 RepID=UPI0032EE1E9A